MAPPVSKPLSDPDLRGCASSHPRLPMHEYCNMLSCMRTTVEIDDALLIRAKKRAAELRCTLRKLIQEALRTQLAKKNRQGKTTKTPHPMGHGDGGIPEEAHIESREAMHEWLRS